MEFKNYTPHIINMNDGRMFEPIGLARVSATFSEVSQDMCFQRFGSIVGLPEPKDDIYLIISSVVLAANNAAFGKRLDLVAPATGHPDCIRNNGQVVSVPCFVRN
jgi:hypothetical protein